MLCLMYIAMVGLLVVCGKVGETISMEMVSIRIENGFNPYRKWFQLEKASSAVRSARDVLALLLLVRSERSTMFDIWVVPCDSVSRAGLLHTDFLRSLPLGREPLRAGARAHLPTTCSTVTSLCLQSDNTIVVPALSSLCFLREDPTVAIQAW